MKCSELYGIPAIYAQTTFRNYQVTAMTKLYRTALELRLKVNEGMDSIDVLVFFRDLVNQKENCANFVNSIIC